MPTKSNRKPSASRSAGKSSNSSISRRSNLFSRRNMLAAAILAILCIGTGTFLVYKSYAAGCTSQLLVRGSHNWCVGQLQSALQIANHFGAATSPGGIDYSFGPNTYNSVVSYQRRAGLGVDGKVGPKTWNNICNYLTFRENTDARNSYWWNRDWATDRNLGC